uniref:FAD/NAD(P)-binding domain-containing protein n=1 Tax=Eptatretus burgeri TaxID=7764 RepID=A0A8C4NA35_EPTBU
MSTPSRSRSLLLKISVNMETSGSSECCCGMEDAERVTEQASEVVVFDDGSLTLPVIVVGNGPSAIFLSLLLSGWRPQIVSEPSHSNPLLDCKLKELAGQGLFEQDLEYLSQGLEGRTSNPVSLLLDALLRPDADCGSEQPSLLDWHCDSSRAIPHLVLGRGPPGGSWNDMEGSMRTLSLGSWMELPVLSFKDWMLENRRNFRNDRATAADVAAYYRHYVHAMCLDCRFITGTHVTSVKRITPPAHDHSVASWEVNGHHVGTDQQVNKSFRVRAATVVLATGSTDMAVKLGVPGEELSYVGHTAQHLEAILKETPKGLSATFPPVLVIGGGFSAADAVLALRHAGLPVIHAFRSPPGVSGHGLAQLPSSLYPEYHKVLQMMHLGNESYYGFTSLPSHRVLCFLPNNKVLLAGPSNSPLIAQTVLAVAVRIGSAPDLSFLPEGGQALARYPNDRINPRSNPVALEPLTHETEAEPGLFAIGPLAGDKFVRFSLGGVLAVAVCIASRQETESIKT